MAGFVHDLGGHKELGVGVGKDIGKLGADEDGGVLSVEELAEAPGGEEAVHLLPLGGVHLVPVGGVVDVDQLVGDETLFQVHRLGPVDVGGGVPLVPLGILVEALQVLFLHFLVMQKDCLVLGVDNV